MIWRLSTSREAGHDGNFVSGLCVERGAAISFSMGLLELAQSGDSHAFEQLIRPHLSSIRRFVFAFSRHWDDADDLAQEALIKAFRSLPSFEGRSSLSTWLYAVTRSVCHDYYRARQAKSRELEDPLSEEHVDDGDTQETLLQRKDDNERLWSAIKQLDPEFRTAVVLCDVEGLSYAEVAQVEQVPVGTVRSRLSRGRARLRQALLRSDEGTRSSSQADSILVAPLSTVGRSAE